MLCTKIAKLNWLELLEFILMVLCSFLVTMMLVVLPLPGIAVHQAPNIPLTHFILLKKAKKKAAGLETL